MHLVKTVAVSAVLCTFAALPWAAAAEKPEVGLIPEGREPQVAVDPDGKVYVAFGVGNEIRLAASEDRGKTFRSPAKVGAVPALSLGMRRGPRIALAGRRLVITAIGGEQGKGRDGDLFAWRSDDRGPSWVGPARINSVAGSAREGLHGMASARDGQVFVAWLDLRNGRAEVYGALSGDGGATWGGDGLVYRSPDCSVCQCCHPSVAFAPDGTLEVMWRNQINGFRDLYLISSADGGRTFGAAAKLGRVSWSLNACPMDGGAVAVDEAGQVETVWMREGAVFAAPPGRPETRLGRGVQAWVAAGPGGFYRVWLESRPGRLLAVLPGDRRPRVLAEQANDPVVAAAPGSSGPVVAAWESGGAAGIALTALDEGAEPRKPSGAD